MPVSAAAVVVVAVVAAVVGSAAEVEMFVVVVAVAQERQLTGRGDRQKLERAARRPSVVLDGIVVVQRVAVDADIPTSEKILHEEWLRVEQEELCLSMKQEHALLADCFVSNMSLIS